MCIKLYINIQNKIKINKHKKNYIKKNVDAVKAIQKQKIYIYYKQVKTSNSTLVHSKASKLKGFKK